MPDSYLRQFLRSLAHGPAEQADLTDADLLRRFLDHRDPAAFEVLLWRHAALVLTVCRRVLPDPADVEDAFQATFLVFLCKAGSIRRRQAVASWLYQVAHRTARRARRSASRRTAHEMRVVPRTAEEPATAPFADVRPVLDEELSRLPEKYRAPLVLHYLQGLNKEETARLLRCPVGTVSSRLHRGQEQLRRRLVRRGLTLTAAGLAALLPGESASALTSAERIRPVVQVALSVAAGGTWESAGVAPAVRALAGGVLRRMFLVRLGKVAAGVLLVGLLAGAGTAAAVGRPGQPEARRPAPTDGQPPGKKGDADRFANAPGYVWAVPPQEVGSGELTNRRDVLGTLETGPDGALVVTVTHPPRYSRAGRPYYRPVAFDADGRRRLFAFASGSMDDRRAVNRYRLPAAQARYVGVEELPPEGRQRAAEHAARLAHDRGIATLPLAEVGRPYDFTLTADDGRPVRGRDLRGKVVVIQGWADWHAGSLQQRAALRDLYRRRHADGLEVIGIDLNNESGPGRPADPVPWPNVRVPRDLPDRELWEQSSEVLALPRVLVLDRRGVLRSDTPRDLEAAVAPLLREPLP